MANIYQSFVVNGKRLYDEHIREIERYNAAPWSPPNIELVAASGHYYSTSVRVCLHNMIPTSPQNLTVDLPPSLTNPV
jgi:hypothetical protein